jgi:phospholipid/cholesterol/gamma-HCH transport system substrate-binding protein
MSLQRVLASVALVAALVVVPSLILGCGRAGDREYKLRFTHAGLVVKGADVQIGGQRVGSVRKVSLTDTGEAQVTVGLKGSAPELRVGTTASLEEPSLSGAANRYVSINPGPDNAKPLPRGATIGSADTTSVVELDELYNLLDPKTRDGLRDIIRGQADAYRGRSADAYRFFETFAPALQASDRVFRDLADDQTSLSRFLVASGRLATTLRLSSADLEGAVVESAGATRAFADAADPLALSLRRLPGTLAAGRRGFAALRAALPDLNAFLTRAPIALRGLPAFADGLSSTLNDERSFRPLAELLRGPAASDDLVDLLRATPDVARRGVPALRASRPALTRGKPLIDQFRPYMPELVAGWGNSGRALAPYDANGHYARVLPQFGAFKEVVDGGVVKQQPIPEGERALGPRTGDVRRCPGGGTQPRPGEAAPVAVPGTGCDPAEVPPGP